jgi:hypothetical protein
MVDVSLLQSLSYVAAAIGVCAAAVYYVMILRATERNRKIQLSTNITQRLGTKEFQRDYVEISTLDWRDLDDFRKRYDHSVNHESFAQRWSVWGTYDNLGYLLREGLVDREIMFNSLGFGSVMIWGRYKPVIDDIRVRELGSRWLENFEYLAEQMWQMSKTRGYTSPGFKDGLIFDRYGDVFEPMSTPPP